ncbi:kinase-like protein [Nemania serpens]|nr:kinase-like protein [Nemania serpens]
MSTESQIESKPLDFTAEAVNLTGETRVEETTCEGDTEKNEDECIEYNELWLDDIEDIDLYNEGGHHPVNLGDVLNDRYEVVHKLGIGGFGLVWLCRDTMENRWRAIKIMAAEQSKDCNEERIYSHLLKQSSSKNLRKEHLALPSEQFWIDGPNGRHYCLALPVLGPTVADWLYVVRKNSNPEQLLNYVLSACRQIAQGVHTLHKLGVCHGDLKPSNVMMELKGLDDLDKAQILELLGEPETFEITTESGKPPAPRAPECVVLAPYKRWWKKSATSSVSIIDFGASFLTTQPPELGFMSTAYAAPEVLWQTQFQPGPCSDIWSLAATFFEILTMLGMFSGEDLGSAIKSFEYFLGGIPDPYRSIYHSQWCAATGRPAPERKPQKADQVQSIDESKWEKFPMAWDYETLVDSRRLRMKGSNYGDPLEAALGRESSICWKGVTDEEPKTTIKYAYPRKDVVRLADLLRKMLRYDLAKRITAEEVINHPALSRFSGSDGLTGALEYLHI